MTDIVLPALSEDGWVTHDARQADYMFAHFFLTDYSQTQLYLGHVSSLAWILLETQGDYSKAAGLTEATLKSYFSRYFNNVVVEVQVKPDPNSPNKGEMFIYLTFNGKDGKAYSIGKLATIENSKIRTVTKLNNYGSDLFTETNS